ncbi:MAG: 2-keto-4-pentenoate hydratase [Thermodesulfobacteriota bacterium]
MTVKNGPLRTVVTFVAAIILLACPAFAADPLYGVVESLTTSYLNRTPFDVLGSQITLEEARKIQERFVREIGRVYGPIVGYKVALTNPAVQRRFNVSHPLRGVLLERMVLKNGARLTADFGIRPMVEGDLMVQVGSESINNAITPQEALAAIDAVIPFIELPDIVYGEGVRIDGAAIVAINTGARYGVVGDPILVAPTDEWERRLAEVKVTLLDGEGKRLAEGRGSNLLGHPLKVLLWLVDSLKAEGKGLKAGDLISLGSITRMAPVQPGLTVRGRYDGLDPGGPIEVSVSFE